MTPPRWYRAAVPLLAFLLVGTVWLENRNPGASVFRLAEAAEAVALAVLVLGRKIGRKSAEKAKNGEQNGPIPPEKM